jgi:serine/threonine protein kinase
VLKLVEGQTVQRPLPLEEALPIARQICDAVEAADEKGIVYRDLKPANAKVTPEGKVKVLDFGWPNPSPTTGRPPIPRALPR